MTTCAGVVIAGLALRIMLAMAAPRIGYAWDHFDILGMGLVGAERGITRVYSADPGALPVLRGQIPHDGGLVTIERRSLYPPNYPPFAQVVFWRQATFLDAGDPGFIANTGQARVATSAASWVCELLVAIGIGLLAYALTSEPRVGGVLAALVWLAPPLMMNSGLFGQYDAFALAPMVFAVLAMVKRRWPSAGACVGLSLLLKPQGLLLVPIAGFASVIGADDGVVVTRRLAAMATMAFMVVVVGSAPWMLADGLAWIERCYRANLLEVLPYTTLEAFNLWYLLALVTERQPVFDVLLSTASFGGISLDAWGRCLLAAALTMTAALCWWRFRSRPEVAVVVFAGLWLWAVFIWPTRVHERYILFCVPFMVVVAAVLPRLRLPVVALVVVATMEHGWMIWRSGVSVGTFDRQTIERFHDERVHASQQQSARLPTFEESTAVAFEYYRANRMQSAWLEWSLVMLSLGAYASGVMGVLQGGPRVANRGS